MPGLAQLQEAFIAAVLDDAASPPGVAGDALEAYRLQVRANHCNALALTFPVVRRLVGGAFFDEAVSRYVRRFPSRSGDLGDLGGELGDFLEAYAPAAVLPYLADVARLEWAIHESSRAPDANPFDYAALARVAPAAHGTLRAVLAPSARLLASPHPVLAIWQANQPDRDGAVDRDRGPDSILVWRAGLESRAERIEGSAWDVLEALARGESLDTAAECAGAQLPRFPGWLQSWCASGVIAALELPASAA